MATALDDFDESTISLSEFPELWAAHERQRTRLALAAARFEASGEFGIDGATTMPAWLRNDCRMSHTGAGTLLRDGRFLRDHGHVAAAALDSTLSAGQIHALRTNVRPETAHVFAEQEQAMVAIIAPLDVRTTEQACTAWRLKAEAVTDQREPSLPERKLSCNRTPDGTLIGGFTFDGALATAFEKALGIAIHLRAPPTIWGMPRRNSWRSGWRGLVQQLFDLATLTL
jgi:hypothetical protein